MVLACERPGRAAGTAEVEVGREQVVGLLAAAEAVEGVGGSEVATSRWRAWGTDRKTEVTRDAAQPQTDCNCPS